MMGTIESLYFDRFFLTCFLCIYSYIDLFWTGKGRENENRNSAILQKELQVYRQWKFCSAFFLNVFSRSVLIFKSSFCRHGE